MPCPGQNFAACYGQIRIMLGRAREKSSAAAAIPFLIDVKLSGWEKHWTENSWWEWNEDQVVHYPRLILFISARKVFRVLQALKSWSWAHEYAPFFENKSIVLTFIEWKSQGLKETIIAFLFFSCNSLSEKKKKSGQRMFPRNLLRGPWG